ncbi:MAG: AAA family ATPase, partial [Thermoplasmata archaeon]
MGKRLPIGISSFEEIRKGNYYYVDKTSYVAKLV